MTIARLESLFATTALFAISALVGCAAPANDAKSTSTAAPPPDRRAESNAAAPSTAPTAAQPARAPSPLAQLESDLSRQLGDAQVQISRTADGALLLRATGDAAFKSGSAVPGVRFNQFLQQLAKELKTYTGLSAKVSGHTDSVGNERLNDRLSQARANATVSRLVALGVAADRLAAEGKGQREPVASNDTAEGRAANRRVELLIVDTGR